MNYQLFTSESVCAGHPDKICDQISDAILDEALRQDPFARVAIETAVKDRVLLLGELTTTAKIDFEAIARAEIQRLGYIHKAWGFHAEVPVEVHINQQSPEIAQGVDDLGAGDQGMMFGYATNETPEYMPLPIVLAHALARQIDAVRESGELAFLRPDGKTQVTVAYQDNKPVGIEKVVLALAHDESVLQVQVFADAFEKIIKPVLSKYDFSISTKQLVVNGTGAWHIPGPASDAGLTGRKIIVDGYGGMARVGGGAFSGKDPSKVDRSGAYAARYIAKNMVAAGLADRVEVALAYVIGQPLPVMQSVESFGTATLSQKEMELFVKKLLDTSVTGIIDQLDLRRPIYAGTAAYGHFGNPALPWEQIAR